MTAPEGDDARDQRRTAFPLPAGLPFGHRRQGVTRLRLLDGEPEPPVVPELIAERSA